MWAHSFSQFLAMGGYAFFVWTSFAVALGMLVLNSAWAWARLRRVRRDLMRVAYKDKVSRDETTT